LAFSETIGQRWKEAALMAEMKAGKNAGSIARRHGRTPRYLAAPALIEGEDKVAYKALRSKIFAYVDPDDIFEEIFADEIVNLQWEAMRWRRLKAALMRVEQRAEVRRTLMPFIAHSEIQTLLKGWETQDPTHTENLELLLEHDGNSFDMVTAKTLPRALGHIERIDALALAAEMRRSRALQDLGSHRQRLAIAMTSAIKEVEDAEFTVVKAANSDAGTVNAA
jgi:hypothetical protein